METGNEYFLAMKDACDALILLRHAAAQKASGLAFDVKNFQKESKLPFKQISNLLEILSFEDEGDPSDKYRLELKKKILREQFEELHLLDKATRIEKLHEIYEQKTGYFAKIKAKVLRRFKAQYPEMAGAESVQFLRQK